MSETNFTTKLKNFIKNKKTIAFLAGAFLTLAFAPIYFFPALFISLSVFYLLLEAEQGRKRDIFWLGFAFGFGHFLTGIYWIAISLLVDASQFAWLIPFALTLIPGACAAYLGVLSLIYKFFTRHLGLTKSYQKIILFSLTWLIIEMLRANLFSGFPWNLIGYSWMFNSEFSQIGSIFGIYGLSLLIVLTALVPVIFWKRKASLGDKIYTAGIALFLISSFTFGHFYIDDSKLTHHPETKIRLVQANIKQNMKWDGEKRYRNFIKHIALTNSKNPKGIKAVIWPESAVPYVLNKSLQLMRYIEQAIPEDGILITGSLRMKEYEGKKDLDLWNSIFVLNRGGISQTYDKHHLVPFGEYIPLHDLLSSFLLLSSIVDEITGGGKGFSEGKGPQTLFVDGFSFSPLVCYEAIFSPEVVDRDHLPDVFVNLTNDAWFGNSSGPYQHFDMSRMRAIEYGIPLIRAANTGITAFVDPFGRIITELPRNEMAVRDIELVKNSQSTIYASFGMIPTNFLVLFLLLILITNQRKKPNVQTSNAD
jgi:apolipoprotein N-acyltransferase